MCSLTKPFSSTIAVDLDCSRHGRLKYGQSGHHVRTIGGMVGGSYLWQVDVDLRVQIMTYIWRVGARYVIFERPSSFPLVRPLDQSHNNYPNPEEGLASALPCDI